MRAFSRAPGKTKPSETAPTGDVVPRPRARVAIIPTTAIKSYGLVPMVSLRWLTVALGKISLKSVLASDAVPNVYSAFLTQGYVSPGSAGYTEGRVSPRILPLGPKMGFRRVGPPWVADLEFRLRLPSGRLRLPMIVNLPRLRRYGHDGIKRGEPPWQGITIPAPTPPSASAEMAKQGWFAEARGAKVKVALGNSGSPSAPRPTFSSVL